MDRQAGIRGPALTIFLNVLFICAICSHFVPRFICGLDKSPTVAPFTNMV